MALDKEESNLLQVNARLRTLDTRIGDQIRSIELTHGECVEKSTALKRLDVLREYRHALEEDRSMILQRIKILSSADAS